MYADNVEQVVRISDQFVLGVRTFGFVVYERCLRSRSVFFEAIHSESNTRAVLNVTTFRAYFQEGVDADTRAKVKDGDPKTRTRARTTFAPARGPPTTTLSFCRKTPWNSPRVIKTVIDIVPIC